MLSFSSHKMYGPKGVGALFLRGGHNEIPIEPLFFGGGQENGLRSGTLNVPGIVGFGEASRICIAEVQDDSTRIGSLRDILESELCKVIPSIQINGSKSLRLPNTSSLIFPGIDAEELILNSPQIMVGTGSACSSGAIEPSHVLTAIGLSREMANSTIRISLGRFTSSDQIETAIREITLAWDGLSKNIYSI